MVRMSDLFKKSKKEMEPEGPPKEAAPEKKAKEALPSGKPVEFAKVLYRESKEPPKEDIAQEVMRASIPDEKEARKLYFDAIKFTQNTFNLYKTNGKINKEDIINTSEKIVNNILLGSHELLKLFHELDSLKFHRYYNAVNVATLSVEIGLVYKYNKSILVDLAIVALLHDLDLIKSKEIIEKSARLKREELEQVRSHPLNIATFIDHAFDFKDEMVKGLLQHHERKKGQGYPDGLIENDIHELAIIVGIADTYEAMTHSRPYKKKLSPHAAILAIINNSKDLFPNQLTKALVVCVGLYPLGSWVELNTGDIGRVLMISPDSPLRPLVNIVMDRGRKQLKEMRTVDLQKIPSLYIKQAAEGINKL